MTVIRTPEQGMLAELAAVGRGLLLRYESLAANSDASLAATLQGIIERRTPLLEQLTEAESARGDLPDAGDREINDIRAAIDSFAGMLLGEQSARQRLLAAEGDWAKRLRSANALDWNDIETEILQALAADNDASLSALSG